jgi:hypothetical protein
VEVEGRGQSRRERGKADEDDAEMRIDLEDGGNDCCVTQATAGPSNVTRRWKLYAEQRTAAGHARPRVAAII